MVENKNYLFRIAWPMAALWSLSVAGAQELGKDKFDSAVLPVMKRYCADCHTRETSERRWAFDRYSQYADLLADQQAWKKAKQLVAGHIMPPEGAASPSAEERRILVEWIEQFVFYVDPEHPDPGAVTLRRMNRSEYNNSIRGLFAIESHFADQFPADDSGYGFDNIADVLSVSPLHIEKYLAAAREVAAEVTRLEPPLRVGVELLADKLTVFKGQAEKREKEVILRAPGDLVGTTVQIPHQSIYRIVTRSSGTQDKKVPPRLEILCDDRVVATIHQADSSQTLVELPAGEHQIALRIQAADASSLERGVPIRFLGIAGPFTPLPPQPSHYLRQALGSRLVGVPVLRLSGEDLDHGSGRSSLDTGRAWFSSNGYRHAPVLLRDPGRYRFRFKVGAQQAGDEPVQFEIRLADRKLGPFSVTAQAQAEQWLEGDSDLPAGEHDFQVWFVNEYKDATTGRERWLWLHEFTMEGPLADDDGLSREEVLQLLVSTQRRLFRGSQTATDGQKITRLLDAALSAGESTTGALRVGLEALLASPRFLYHPVPHALQEDNRTPAATIARIDELTLASRLSSFLWSSIPDETLLTLAERGNLRSQFAEQVTRMLSDSKRDALTSNFAGQWLHLRNLDQLALDRDTYPDLDSEFVADMRLETEKLFEHILRGNRSVVEFLNADYSFVNARLAKHYGLSIPSEDGFQQVSLAGSSRRGVVTHASILTITSMPNRTSPVKRGKWLLEQLLGDEPPPPPADVPPLPAERENERLPLRVRLEQHRRDPRCASCHAMLDPWGFALENYDGIGRWRTTDSGNPIDASGQLITGEKFSSWDELRDLLVGQRREDFVRCLVEHLLTYALGRGLTYQDKPAVNEIVARGKASNYKFQDLILAVCESVPFQWMPKEVEQ